MMNKTALIIISLFVPSILYAQECIKGIVIDKQRSATLSETHITVVGDDKRGTISDAEGHFQISLKKSDVETLTLRFKRLGYSEKEHTFSLHLSDSIHRVYLEESEIILNQVVVMGKSKERQLIEGAMPISVIEMKHLKGSVGNITELLSKTMSVTTRNTGGLGSPSRVSVRGLEGKRIGVFINETPIANNSDFVNINDIPLEIIDRIEIYKGIVPAKLGGSAVGGAINIVIKEYPENYGESTYTIGSFNTHKLGALFKKRLRNQGIQVGVNAYASFSKNNYTMKSPHEENRFIERTHDRYKNISFGGDLKSHVWWFDEVELELHYSKVYKQTQGISYDIRQAHMHASVLSFSNTLKKKNFLIEGLDLHASSALGGINTRHIDTALTRYNWDGQPFASPSPYGGELSMFPSYSNNYAWAISNKTNLNYTMNTSHSLNVNVVYRHVNHHPHDTLNARAVGCQVVFPSTANLLTTGLTHEYRSSTDKWLNAFSLKHYYYGVKTHLAHPMGIDKGVDINFKKNSVGMNEALRYRITPTLLIKTSVAYDVRLPSEQEMLGDGYFIFPAGYLKPERILSANMGGIYSKQSLNRNRSLQLEFNLFYAYLKEMIRFTSGAYYSQYQNFGEMRSIGIEGEVKGDLTKHIYCYLNAAYQDMRDTRDFEPDGKTENATKGLRMPNIPFFMMNAGVELHRENLLGGKGANSRLFADLSFVEEYFFDFEQSIYQKRRIPRALSLNIGLEQRLFSETLIVAAKINNLTNRRLLSEFNKPLPGRHFALNIRYRFK